MQKGRESARQNGFLPGWLTFTRPPLTRHLLLWFFMGGVFILSGISILSGNESDTATIFGAVSLMLGGYMLYLGGTDKDVE